MSSSKWSSDAIGASSAWKKDRGQTLEVVRCPRRTNVRVNRGKGRAVKDRGEAADEDVVDAVAVQAREDLVRLE